MNACASFACAGSSSRLPPRSQPQGHRCATPRLIGFDLTLTPMWSTAPSRVRACFATHHIRGWCGERCAALRNEYRRREQAGTQANSTPPRPSQRREGGAGSQQYRETTNRARRMLLKPCANCTWSRRSLFTLSSRAQVGLEVTRFNTGRDANPHSASRRNLLLNRLLTSA